VGRTVVTGGAVVFLSLLILSPWSSFGSTTWQWCSTVMTSCGVLVVVALCSLWSGTVAILVAM